MNKCPYWDVCVTPNWYGDIKKDFIEEVCLNDWEENAICRPFIRGTSEWKKTAKYIRESKLYKNRYDLEFREFMVST